MPITVASIMESIARDIDDTYRRLRRSGMKVDIPEVNVNLSLEVELDGVEEEPARPRQPSLRPFRRVIMDQKTLATQGLSFRRIATPSFREGREPTDDSEKNLRNLEIRFTFVPNYDEEGGES